MTAATSLLEHPDLLADKIAFLSHAEAYGADTTKVEVIETHMSMVFLTDRFVYKLKKPVWFEFLDFSTLEARHQFCLKEVRVNHPLAGDTYMGVVPLTFDQGHFQLNGEGRVVEWIVKMKRLPRNLMLHEAIRDGMVPKEWAQLVAEKLVTFYLTEVPVDEGSLRFRNNIIQDVELNSAALLNRHFKLSISLVVGITTDLLLFIIKHADLFERRVRTGRIIDAHGDLRPEHICLGPDPVIIDRIEFNKDLRIMDVAEELSFFALECEMQSAPDIGQLFLHVYQRKGHDAIPGELIHFYKAKRAFLRARLSIEHLREKKYAASPKKWTDRCDMYLRAASSHCKHLI